MNNQIAKAMMGKSNTCTTFQRVGGRTFYIIFIKVLGASQYECNKKYTLELQTEKYKLGCAGSFHRYIGREYVCTRK